jgi:nicotinamidase-related amidase
VPIDLRTLLSPRHTAVLTMEIQRGVVGDRSSFPQLADAVRASNMLPAVRRLLGAAREAGAVVVHCTAGFRADRAGSPANAPLITAMLRRPAHLLEGTDAVDLVPEIGADAEDLVSHRRHGVSPFGGTDLQTLLDGRGVRTVVATGVSLNLGIPGLCVEAVNLGYQVVVPVDAVTGIPADYARAVLDNTVSLVATLSNVDEVVSALRVA